MVCNINSQLALDTTNHLQQTTSIAQNNVTLVILSNKANLLKAILDIAHLPHLSDKLIARPNGRGKAGLELLHIGRIAATQFAQNTVRSRVPAEKAVDNNTAETHLLTGLGCGVERVVVAIETDRS